MGGGMGWRWFAVVATLLWLVASALPLHGFGSAPGPRTQMSGAQVVISEVRTRGASGVLDEFVEIYNRSDTAVDISGWQLWFSDGSGQFTSAAIVADNTILPPRHHFLFRGTEYDDAVAPDEVFTDDLTDDGGVALVLPDSTTMVDGVAFSANATGGEGTP